MYDAIINVGMVSSDGSKTFDIDEVFAALHANGIIAYPTFATVVESDSEPTVVVHAIIAADSDVYNAAVDLEQDCIAVWAGRAREGSLIGPNAKKWGPFNPRFFFLPSGKRLSDLIGEEEAA